MWSRSGFDFVLKHCFCISLYIFVQFVNLPLKEFYYEQNPLLEEAPVQSIQEDEVLSLKVKPSLIYSSTFSLQTSVICQ